MSDTVEREKLLSPVMVIEYSVMQMAGTVYKIGPMLSSRSTWLGELRYKIHSPSSAYFE